MKKFTCLMGLALALLPSSGQADMTLRGDPAKRIWDEISGPDDSGPYCTGLCRPNESCDPKCFSARKGQGWQCSRIEYLRSHRVEYECTRS